jgi:hypothetical protein
MTPVTSRGFDGATIAHRQYLERSMPRPFKVGHQLHIAMHAAKLPGGGDGLVAPASLCGRPAGLAGAAGGAGKLGGLVMAVR